MTFIINPFFVAPAGDIGGFRYWRLKLEGASAYYGAGEIEFRKVIGGANVATGGTAFASSSFSGSYLPAKAFDGSTDPNTGSWVSGVTSGVEYIGYDFGVPRVVTEFVYTKRTGFDSYAPGKITLQYSSDNVTWTDAFESFPSLWTGVSSQTFSAPSGARYWRLSFTGTGVDRSLAEVQFRETNGGSNVATGGTAIASSILSNDAAQFGPAKAFDGNSSTFWHAAAGATGTQFIGYDFGSGVSKEIVEFSVTCRSGQPGQAPTTLLLEKSSNNSTWTTVETFYFLPFLTNPTQVRSRNRTQRYWRLLATTTGGNRAMATMELRTSVGGANQATGGAAFSNSVLAGDLANYGPANMFDNNSSTFWHSNGDTTAWVGYDFGANVAKEIAQISLTARSGQPGQAPTTVILQKSLDANTWTDVINTAAASWSTNPTQTFNA